MPEYFATRIRYRFDVDATLRDTADASNGLRRGRRGRNPVQHRTQKRDPSPHHFWGRQLNHTSAAK